MPRTKRYFGEIGLNHCIIRGIDKGDIFFDDQDRHKFIKVIKNSKEKNKISLGAYSLMPNHVHFLVQGENRNISEFFKSLEISYASYFNLKYDRIGHLFQDRYKNKPVDNIEYLQNVVKYIHFNPEKAKICKAKNYLWSSYKEYFKKETWLDTEIVLKYYNEDINKALFLFEEQHSSELDDYYEYYSEYEIVNRLTDDEVKCIIDEKNNKYMDFNSKSIIKNLKKEVIKEVLNISGVSVNQVSRVTGINRKILSKLKEKGQFGTGQLGRVPNCPRR